LGPVAVASSGPVSIDPRTDSVAASAIVAHLGSSVIVLKPEVRRPFGS
jgi:hypothetical protein